LRDQAQAGQLCHQWRNAVPKLLHANVQGAPAPWEAAKQLLPREARDHIPFCAQPARHPPPFSSVVTPHSRAPHAAGGAPGRHLPALSRFACRAVQPWHFFLPGAAWGAAVPAGHRAHLLPLSGVAAKPSAQSGEVARGRGYTSHVGLG
jgi:hypothetical protein